VHPESKIVRVALCDLLRLDTLFGSREPITHAGGSSSQSKMRPRKYPKVEDEEA
jgi:hypothetical protein